LCEEYLSVYKLLGVNQMDSKLEELEMGKPEIADENAGESTSLNLKNLDVEELEHRLELASVLQAYPCGVQWGY
jgi:hypothetical protein